MQLQMYWEVQYMNMHDYLMTVSEQIRCRRAWPMIEKELRIILKIRRSTAWQRE